MLIVCGDKKGGPVNNSYALLLIVIVKGQSNADTGSCTLLCFSCLVHLPRVYGYDVGLLIGPEVEVCTQACISVCEDFWVPS